MTLSTQHNTKSVSDMLFSDTSIFSPKWNMAQSVTICPNIWIGPCGVLNNEWLQSEGFTHNIDLSKTGVQISDNINRLIINIDDNDVTNISSYFETCNAFITGALEHKGKILINCLMGMSRSPTIVIAYLIKTFKLTPMQALDEIRKTRLIVDPNCRFMAQLDAYYTTLFVNSTYTSFVASTVPK
jgi:hypothetical protein